MGLSAKGIDKGSWQAVLWLWIIRRNIVPIALAATLFACISTHTAHATFRHNNFNVIDFESSLFKKCNEGLNINRVLAQNDPADNGQKQSIEKSSNQNQTTIGPSDQKTTIGPSDQKNPPVEAYDYCKRCQCCEQPPDE